MTSIFNTILYSLTIYLANFGYSFAKFFDTTLAFEISISLKISKPNLHAQLSSSKVVTEQPEIYLPTHNCVDYKSLKYPHIFSIHSKLHSHACSKVGRIMALQTTIMYTVQATQFLHIIICKNWVACTVYMIVVWRAMMRPTLEHAWL